MELEILVPHINNNLNANVAATGFEPNLVAIGGAPLDWTASPKLDIGYRFGEGLGSAEFSYRLISTEGREILIGWDLDGSDAPLKTRLDMNVFDFDYVSRDYNFGSICDLQWRAGIRLATIHFDSRAEGYFLEQQASDNFVGAGPHAGLVLTHRFGNSQFGIFGGADTSVNIGQVHQSINETFVAQDGSVVGGATDVDRTQAVPTLGIQLGLSWTPVWRGCVSRYSLGYEFEQWWSVGDAGSSRADITTNGIFFRGEFNF
jgi:Legionella pneumophila major outer membrane protein precursor